MITKVVKYDDELNGVVNINKHEYHLSGVLVGEEIEVSLSKDLKSVKLIRIVSPSKMRIKEKCTKCKICGGCRLQHLAYHDQLELKTKVVQDLYQKLNLKTLVKPCLGATHPEHYRNKNQVVFKNTHQGFTKIISGFYEEGTHNVVDVADCLIQSTISNEITKTIKELMIKMHYVAYDEDHRTGFFRHVLIRNSFSTKEIMVVLVTASDNFPGSKNFCHELISKHPNITTIVQNINPKQTSMVLGEKEKILYGKGFIIDELLGMKFKISSRSFYQINSEQCAKLYTEALSKGNLSKEDIVLDAYSGVGTIGLLACSKVKKVISVELNHDAVNDAINNARYNNVKNIQFFCDDATKFIVNLALKKEHVDVVIMDPPRKGSDEAFLNAVMKLAPKKIIYVSCDPYTQVRDIEYLKGYQVTSIQPVDMFPYTQHVECVTVLTKKQ